MRGGGGVKKPGSLAPLLPSEGLFVGGGGLAEGGHGLWFFFSSFQEGGSSITEERFLEKSRLTRVGFARGELWRSVLSLLGS